MIASGCHQEIDAQQKLNKHESSIQWYKILIKHQIVTCTNMSHDTFVTVNYDTSISGSQVLLVSWVLPWLQV